MSHVQALKTFIRDLKATNLNRVLCVITYSMFQGAARGLGINCAPDLIYSCLAMKVQTIAYQKLMFIGEFEELFFYTCMIELVIIAKPFVSQLICYRLSVSSVLVAKGGVCKLSGFGFQKEITDRNIYEKVTF